MRVYEFLGLGGFNPGVTAKQWDGRGTFPTQRNASYSNALQAAVKKTAPMVFQAANRELKDAIIADAARYFHISFDDLKMGLQAEGALKESTLEEGIRDPHIFKAVFLAGTPGAGKSTMARRLERMTGLRRIDYDQFHELAIKQARPIEFGRIMDLRDIQLRTYLQGRLGLIIEESGRMHERLRQTKTLVENLGYDTFMIFMNVSLEVAKERVAKRAEVTGREVAADYLEMVHAQAQRNIGHAQQLFGGNFVVVDADAQLNLDFLDKQIRKFLAIPPHRPAARSWLAQHPSK